LAQTELLVALVVQLAELLVVVVVVVGPSPELAEAKVQLPWPELAEVQQQQLEMPLMIVQQEMAVAA